MERSSSLYIHFPFCKQLCSYCDFHRTIGPSAIELEQYENLLKKQFGEITKCFLGENETSVLETLYVGGGTPSRWECDRLKQFLVWLKSKVQIANGAEVTLEANPGTMDGQKLKSYLSLGFNRFSVGVQAYDEDYLKKIGRVHRLSEVNHLLSSLQRSGVNFSVDLMLGLPNIKKRNIRLELDQLLQYNPNHFSVYILTPKEDYCHLNELPPEEQIEREYCEVADYLVRNGYEHYEVSNFARDGAYSKHNLRYWQQETVLALGPSATGFLAEAGTRFKWSGDGTMDIERLSKSEMMLEKLYLGLRTQWGITLSEFFSSKDLSELQPTFKNWATRKLLELHDGQLRLTSKGFLVMDHLVEELHRVAKF